MTDGAYDLSFSADGYTGRGLLVLDGEKAFGSDGDMRVEGNIFDGAQHITAVFNVMMRPDHVHNSRIPGHYSLQMTGTRRDGGFTLIGTGPLGLIVEIACAYVGPSTDEQRRAFET